MSNRKGKPPRPITPAPTPAHESPPSTVPAASRPPKILPKHLDRLAIVYVRQSSPYQVLHHRESRERQYALADRAVALGWSRQRVLVIDEDQGQSGKAADHRLGFHRLLAEVAIEHVGLVLGLEMSRLARSSKDWHHLLELCAVVGALLGDEDGVYDPHDSNDRLLLGLKGTISEFELVTMRNRLERGKFNKALRGELFYNVPTGYVRVTPERIDLDPDEQVRQVIRIIFDKFDELGTVWGVLRYLTQQHIALGIRLNSGPCRGQLRWCRATYGTLCRLLKNPIFAGIYTYGRLREGDLDGSPEGRPAPDAQMIGQRWKVFQRDRLPAYITWERYLANLERLRQNRALPDAKGAARQGAALLAGLIRCGSCGCRLSANYSWKSRPYYICSQHLQKGIEKTCHGLTAAEVDNLVVGQVLLALQPAALELSMRALGEIEKERGALEQHWKQRLERAHYASQEAERRYRAVDPENRLVARTLERVWEEALAGERALADEYDHFRHEQPLRLSPEERGLIEQLSADIPRLWQASQTTAVDRKTIIRHLVNEVIVHVRKDSEYVDVTIQWQGGAVSRHEIQRSVRAYHYMRDYERLLERVASLWEAGNHLTAIARQLDAEGFATTRRTSPFTKLAVRGLLNRQGIRADTKSQVRLEKGEWWPRDLAERIGVPLWKIEYWADHGWIHCRKSPLRKWRILWADGDEVKRLEKLRAGSRHGCHVHPLELTTPKKRG